MERWKEKSEFEEEKETGMKIKIEKWKGNTTERM